MDAGLSAFQVVGFLLASWAVIGNDSLQTLGPFLEANRGRTPRWLQALGLCVVLCGVLWFGWWRGDGDPSWGRLASYPQSGALGWAELLPPLAVLLLTQAGVPVSTSFLVLTAFSPANLPALLRHSLLGYGLALLVGLVIYSGLSLLRRWRARGPYKREGQPLEVQSGEKLLSMQSPPAEPSPRQPSTEPELMESDLGSAPGSLPELFYPPGAGELPLKGPTGINVPILALALQWLAGGWLWSQWLIQDLANVFIFLPRRLGAGTLSLALLALCAGVCLLLAENGGAIQNILRRKSGLERPLAGATLSLVFGLTLALLALWGSKPLSTTWVFLGLLAGRELGLALEIKARSAVMLALDLGRDLALAALGLTVSVALALAVQPLGAGG